MFAKTQPNIRILAVFALTILAVLISSFIFVSISTATPGTGVTAEEISRGDIPESVRAMFEADFNVQTEIDQLILMKYTIVPGGVFGWHQHGGPVWVVVNTGTLSYYHGDDPACTVINYPAGSAFMDPGNQTHNARNEGSEDLVVYTTFMLPSGAEVRIDAPDPGVCDF